MLQLLKKRADLFDSLDPQRIYIENIRSFFNIPHWFAKLMCEMAVQDKVFNKRYGVYCPNSDCKRLIKSFASKKEIESFIECSTCQALEKDSYVFSKEEVEIIIFYQLPEHD